jgi:hypothetical protein
MVAARRRPAATHAPVGAVPTIPPLFFFCVLNLIALMATMPPRAMTSLMLLQWRQCRLGRWPLYLCIYLSASVAYAWGNLDRVRVSGMFADI